MPAGYRPGEPTYLPPTYGTSGYLPPKGMFSTYLTGWSLITAMAHGPRASRSTSNSSTHLLRPRFSSCQPGRFVLHSSLRRGTPIYNEHSRDWLNDRGSWLGPRWSAETETATRLLTMLSAHGQKPDNRTQHNDAASRALALCARPSPSSGSGTGTGMGTLLCARLRG